MIRPTHATKHFSATRVFTDRDDARARFDAVCKEQQPRDSYKVLMWYGVGGQGKSALARECQRRLEELHVYAINMPSKRQYAFAKVDFDDSRMCEIHGALLSMRLQLARIGMRFPAFDLAFARYFALTNPGVDIRHRHP